MRHEYVGDVGDFGKYALLSTLAKHDLSLGVVWCLNTCAESNNDGFFTDYKHLRPCDPALHDRLHDLLRRGNRSLPFVEAARVLPDGTMFYTESVPFPERPCLSPEARRQQALRRQSWHEGGLFKLSGAELVFLDPDNGLAGASVKPYSRNSPKYVFAEEVADWLKTGKSVVLYQHQQRKPLEEHAREQLGELTRSGVPGWALTFHRMAVRIYFVLPANDGHKLLLMERTKAFLDTEWGRKKHFRLIESCG